LLAMDVNDNAGYLKPRGALEFIVGTPPAASWLLQVSRRFQDPVYLAGPHWGKSARHRT